MAASNQENLYTCSPTTLSTGTRLTWTRQKFPGPALNHQPKDAVVNFIISTKSTQLYFLLDSNGMRKMMLTYTVRELAKRLDKRRGFNITCKHKNLCLHRRSKARKRKMKVQFCCFFCVTYSSS